MYFSCVKEMKIIGSCLQKRGALVENAAEAIIVVRDGVITFVNRATVKQTDYTVEELLSRPFLEFIHLEDRESAIKHYRELLEKKSPVYSCPFKVLAKDGSAKWVETNSVVIEWDIPDRFSVPDGPPTSCAIPSWR